MHEILGRFNHRFAEVVIAIVEDHNSGRDHNPRGNFEPFAEVFARPLHAPPPTPLSVNDAGVPTEMCLYGGGCIKLHDPRHTSRFAHPPMCTMEVSALAPAARSACAPALTRSRTVRRAAPTWTPRTGC